MSETTGKPVRAKLRPRTKIYDCNYRLAENLFKPTIEDLDRKIYGKWVYPNFIKSNFTNKKNFFQRSILADRKIFGDPFLDETLNAAKSRAERAIKDASGDSFFDSRGARVPKSQIGGQVPATSSNAIAELENEMKSSINKFRDNKKAFNISDDPEFEEALKAAKERARLAVEKFDAGLQDDATTSSALKKSSYQVSVSKSLWFYFFLNCIL